MFLDPKTLQLVICITNLAMVLALVTVATGHRVAGLWSLAGAALANAFTFGMYFLYEHLPGALVTVLTDATIAVTFSLWLLAIAQLVGRSINRLWVLLPPIAAAVLSAMLLGVPVVRNVTTDGITVLQSLAIAWTLTRDGGIGIGRGRHILLASVVASILLFGTRSLGVATGLIDGPPGSAVAPIDTWSYLVADLMTVAGILGFVLAAAELTASEHEQLAMQDVLTQLPNRRAVLESLSQLWSAALRAERPLTVLMIDVDHFKKINDQHGHAAGDAVLRRLARLLRLRVRQQDIVGRYGGEEFLVLLPDTDRDGARALAETLRTKIDSVPVRARGKDLSVTVSIGMHSLWPTESDTIAEFVHRADEALYRAKAAGRNQVMGG